MKSESKCSCRMKGSVHGDGKKVSLKSESKCS